jgi:hypothetical protein
MDWPEPMIFFGQGIGDDRISTAVDRELKKRDAGKIIMPTGDNPTVQLIPRLTVFPLSQL